VSAAELKWQDRAACHGQPIALFFQPEREAPDVKTAREDAAKAICAGCEVRAQCGGHALGWPERYGTWGGCTEDERQRAKVRAQRLALKEQRQELVA
jgi:WhiB family redox-sensing transcriptional regulator